MIGLPLNWPTPKLPLWYKDLAHISCTSRVITDFVQKAKFSLPSQQGSVRGMLTAVHRRQVLMITLH